MPHRNKKYRKVLRRSSMRNRRITPLEIIIATALVVALVAVGWVLYTPIFNMIMGIEIEKTESSQSSKAIESSSEAINTSSENSSVPETPTEDTEPMRAVYAPTNVLMNEERLASFLKSLKDTEINAIMFDLKDQRGNVLYDSTSPLVLKAQSLTENPIELETAINIIEAEGFVPVGRVNAFMDSIAPALLNQAAVKYQGTDINWIDNFANQGGKLWLNPYSEQAQEYVTEICVEVAKRGIDYIVLDSVQFPSGVGLEKASYGDLTVEKSEQLSRFTERVTKAVEAEESQLFVYLSAGSIVATDSEIYGEKPQSIVDNGLVLGMTSEITEPLYETTLAAISNIKSNYLEKGVKVIALLLTSDRTEEVISEQQRAVEENGITSYIYYDQNGNYKLN